MPEDTSDTRLLEVFKTHYNNMYSYFIVYDTEYQEGYYELPKTDLLVLILISFEKNASGGLNEHLWTTVRRWTPEKEKYYRSIRGECVKVVLEETK